MQPHMRRHVKYFKNSQSLKFLFFFHSFLVSVNNLPFFIFSLPLQALTWEITILPAGVEETLWVHPLGPLESSACLSTSHVMLSNGMLIPANTNAMVSMQVITHDSYPHEFKATKILVADVDLRGGACSTHR